MIMTLSNSTDISLTENTRVTFCDLELYAASIPTERLHLFDVQLRDALRRIVDSGIDMQRMRMVIERERRKVCAFRPVDLLSLKAFSSIACSNPLEVIFSPKP
jgi:hypothetical protein